MKITLSQQEKKELELRHRKERDARICDRIKAVLLKSKGWSNARIAEALFIHEETVPRHLNDWLKSRKVKPENGGSTSKLSEAQSQQLSVHLEQMTYTKVQDICLYVQKVFQISYTISGMTKWLHQNGFSYKQPKLTPAKGNAAQQEQFVEHYLSLLDSAGSDEPIIFADAVHPTMATKVSCGWIKKGKDKLIKQSASRTRENIIGGINLSNMQVVSTNPKTVNSETMINFFESLQSSYPQASQLHIILDQSGYNRSTLVQEYAGAHNIVLHYLPAYSPNLNSIERLWAVMNEYVRDNKFFSSAKEFRQAIANFFDNTVHDIKDVLRSRINDNFHMLNPAS